ncbi:MAG TPA: type II secretion system protein N [Casimicrobiaceae bacterium]
MRVLLRVVLGLVVLAAAFLLLAPAALVDGPIMAGTGNHLRLVDTSGVWWRGRGAVATLDGAVRVPVAWRVAFAPLLTGALVVTLVRHDAAMPSGTVTVRHEALDVRDLQVAAPAALVSALVPALTNVALGGELDLRAPSFTWRNNGGSGTMDATWQHARIVAGAPIDLGRVLADAKPVADGLAASVRNAGGDLAIDGSVALHGNVVSASFKLTPAAGASQAVRAMLPLLGAADSTGAVTLAWRSDRR